MTLLELQQKLNKFISENPELGELSLVNEDDFGLITYSGNFTVMWSGVNRNDCHHLYFEHELTGRTDIRNIEKVVMFN